MAQQYQRATGLRVPIAIDDGQMARAFGVGPIPHTAIFDASSPSSFALPLIQRIAALQSWICVGHCASPVRR